MLERAVELDHSFVDGDLVLGVHAVERLADFGVDGLYGLEDAFAEVL